MNKKWLLIGCILSTLLSHAQQYRYYAGYGIRFLKTNNDSLTMPFTGGFNAPQFSNVDLNQDGKNDLFVFDRSTNKVTTFLKTENGFRHAFEYEGHFPFMNDWCLLRDFDADGKNDVFTEVDSDVRFLYDTIQNPVSNGMRIFKNKSTSADGLKFVLLHNQAMDTGGFWIDFGVPKAPERIGANVGDIPGIGDIDNDLDADVLTFQQLDLSPFYYENYVKNKHNLQYKPDSIRFILRDQCWGYMQYDATSMRNRFNLGLNKQDLGACMFQMYEKHARHAATTLAMFDYTGDGVTDIVYGDGAFKNLILLVNGKNQNWKGRDSIIAQDTAFPSNTVPAQFILFPAAYYVDYDADGKRDLLVTTNDHVSAKSVNNVWRYNNTGTDAKPVFLYVGNSFFGYDETIDLGTRSVPVLVDIDSDGDKDLIVATNGDYEIHKNLNDRLVLYINTPENGKAVFKLTDSNFLQLSQSAPILNLHPTFADLNGDGKPDLIVGDDAGTLRFYKNNSSGTSYNFQLMAATLDAIDVGSAAAPTFSDVDKNGTLDLIAGNRDGVLKLYINRGTASQAVFNAVADRDSFGRVVTRYCHNTIFNDIDCKTYGYATPYAIDLDGDGNDELVVGSDIGYVYIYSGMDTLVGTTFTKQDMLFVKYNNGMNPSETRHGKRTSVCAGLLDGDNKPDLLIGNLAGGLQFFGSVNAQAVGLQQVSDSKQFRLYPNPASSTLNIQYERLQEEIRYQIVDLTGRIIQQGHLNPFYSEVSVPLLMKENGLYLIVFEHGKNREVHKLFVQH